MPDFNKTIKSYKQAIDRAIVENSQKLITDIKHKYGLPAARVIKAYQAILGRDGKRLRAILAMWSYQSFGGKNQKVAVELADIIEMIHASWLVIDDCTDMSDKRRHGPAAHRLLEEWHRQVKMKGDGYHFGEFQAVNSALAGQYIAFGMFMELPVDEKSKVRAFGEMSDFMAKTVFGQIKDVNNEALATNNETDIYDMLKLKTAYYTFLMPLKIGAILAGATDKQVKFMEPYSLNVGLAFQMRDDIIGTFGDEAETGKSTKDDIMEGKRTILISRAYKKSDAKQKAILDNTLGNKNLTKKQFEEVRHIIRDSGALDYCQKQIDIYAQAAIGSLESAPSVVKGKVGFLRDITEYIAYRQK